MNNIPKQEEQWETEFDEKFTIDNYRSGRDFKDVRDAFKVKFFILRAIATARRQEREKIMEFIKSFRKSPVTDMTDVGWNEAVNELMARIEENNK